MTDSTIENSCLQRPDTLLVFNTAYNFKQIKDNSLEIFIESRDASNLFKKVISINPVADLQEKNAKKSWMKFGSIFRVNSMSDKHLIIEGSSFSIFSAKALSTLMFLLSQVVFLFLSSLKLLQHKVMLVRAEDPRLNGIYGLIASRIFRVPLIVGMWGNSSRIRSETGIPIMPRLFPTTTLEHRVESFILRRADFVLAQNQENLNAVIEMGVDLSKTALTPLGVGISKVHVRPRATVRNSALKDFEPSNAFTLITVSRLEKLKYVDHTIRAAAFLQKSGLHYRLLVVGEGRELQNLQTLCKQLDIEDYVFFVGNKDQRWISEALRSSDVFVSPLCGRALLEAGLAGCPVVAYDVDWHRELVQNGKTGVLVEHLNFEALGAALIFMHENHDLRKSMATEIAALANELCKPTQIADLQRKIYEKVILGNA